MKIYTKTGDYGKTSLGSGERVWKSSSRVDAYGTVDELNATLGVVESKMNSAGVLYSQELLPLLLQIQKDLFSIGSYLANLERASLIEKIEERIPLFEAEIDRMTEELPEIRNFILPSGGTVGSLFHLARTVARRAERRIVEVLQQEEVDPRALKYVNRLSDLLFTMARYTNFKEQKKEIIWSR